MHLRESNFFIRLQEIVAKGRATSYQQNYESFPTKMLIFEKLREKQSRLIKIKLAIRTSWLRIDVSD